MQQQPHITQKALFSIGQVVRHRIFSFRGVIYDVDPVFSNSDEWWESIPAEIRPEKNQPFYHLLAENEESSYEAYVSQQNLLPDDSDDPIDHPEVIELFGALEDGKYNIKAIAKH